ncbi:MAG: S-layer protein domain-containing protein [Candidatus Methanoperedens sp.]|nr:S-layer protein domain-containing protein [Candidatus Methanoperedens sp.]
MLRYIILALLTLSFFTPIIPTSLAAECADCHSSYNASVNSTHNQTRNASAPSCTDCHAGYVAIDNHTTGTKGFTVNESNTCTVSCHINGTARLTERHSSSSDCTKCHFANTTQRFSLNNSLFTHDHNLTVEHNFYDYNISGIPLTSNSGVGIGMFPYYACTLTCHSNRKIENATSGWYLSAHARSRHGNETYDSKNSCAKCKSPPNYNASASSGTAISEADWKGIQCRVCHNIHNRKVSTSIGGEPLAYYNSTSSSQAGYPVYEAVANATVLCEKCHTGSSHDSKFAGYHKVNLSFTCASCHANGTYSNYNHTFEVKNTTSGVTGCEVCHETADHTWSFTSLHLDNVTCEACHDQTFVLNATNFSVTNNGTGSYNNGLYKNTTTNKWTIYKISSGVPATWPLHNISRSVNCTKCHNASSPWNGTTRRDTLIAGNISSIRSCISCHDTGGSSAKQVNFSALNNSNSVHSTLNYNISTAVSTSNSRCWGCHGDGDGSESAQPTNDHPSNYNTPKNCNNNDCHSVSQSGYNETMVYSHFKNASRNDNPGNVTSYNITTIEPCENCHVNSLVTEGTNPNLALASHYASKTKLIDSFNCTYCHLDEDNSEKWGNATLISKNRTSLIEFERIRNKLTASEGETVYLGEGYYLKVLEISIGRENAYLQLIYNGSVVDEILLGTNTQYEYKKKVLINSSVFETPFITLNISSIFKGDKGGLIQFSGSRIKKNHTDRESKNPACYACHLYRSSEEKERYQVIDKEYKTDADDIIYYTKVLTDFKSENKSKVYFNDEDYIFDQLGNQPGKFLNTLSRQKYLIEGETWNISDNYSLKLNEVSTDSNLSWLTLSIDGSVVKDDVAGIGSAFIYSPGIKYKDTTGTNVTIFTANITAVFQGRPNFILLKDVVALSPQILKVTSNTTLFGYNSSWFRINDTFTVGRIPPNLHSPNMRDDTRNWADCAMCHNASKRLRISGIENISTGLGKHSILNIAASNKASLSDSIDKACWACHTEAAEPQTHSPTHIAPRYCTSCHIDRKEPFYGASDINNGTHKFKSDCEVCHIRGSHNLVKPAGFSVISEVTLSQSTVKKGETVNLTAKANAGYGLKVRSAEYFIDTRGTSGNGKPLKAVDGAFDSQVEQMVTEINTADIPAGGHVIYIHAMGTDSKWGEFYSVNFSIVSGKGSGNNAMDRARDFLKRIPGLDMIFVLLSLVAVYFIISGIRRR